MTTDDTTGPAPTRTLVVVDAQLEYVDGAIPIAHPPVAESLVSIGEAVRAAHDAGVRVVLVRHEDGADSPVFAAGGHGAQLVPAIAALPHDAVVVKQTVSAFPAGLEAALGGADTVTLAGYMTQHCIASTARDAADLGLAVEVLSDATGAPPLDTPLGSVSARDAHEGTLAVLSSGFASVVDTATWIDAVRGGRALPEPDLWAATAPARA